MNVQENAKTSFYPIQEVMSAVAKESTSPLRAAKLVHVRKECVADFSFCLFL